MDSDQVWLFLRSTFWSNKFDNVRHLVFKSIFLLLESWVVRYSNTQPHLEKVNEFITKSTVTFLSFFWWDVPSGTMSNIIGAFASCFFDVILQTKQTSVVCPLCCPIYLGSLNTAHVCVTPTMPIARQCKALCTKQTLRTANCKLHSAHPTPVNCGQLTKTTSSLARVIIASESA